MKNKKLKQKQRKIKKDQASYPQQLKLEEYFKCPIWFADAPEFVKDLNKASDKYIEESKKNLKETVNKIYLERKKTYREADFRIKCSFLKPDKIVKKILILYEKSGD